MSTAIQPIELSARFEHVLWAQDGMQICRFRNLETKKTFAAKGRGLPENSELELLLTGTWIESKRGRLFEIQYIDFPRPTTERGTIAYLRTMPGIGEKKAKAIYGHFGTEIWDILDSAPERLNEVRGITKRTTANISQWLQQSERERNLTRALADFPRLTSADIRSVLSSFGDNSLSVIQNQPYELCDVKGLTFDRIDRFVLDHGGDIFAPDRFKYGALSYLTTISTSGSVCLPLKSFVAGIRNYLYPTAPISEENLRKAINKLVIDSVLRYSGGMIYSRNSYDKEQSIAREIIRLRRSVGNIGDGIESAISDYECDYLTLADAQRDAIRAALTNNISVITGGPGTGKTTVIKGLLYCHKRLLKDNSEPVLMAPTGRAARRMSTATGYPAETIHSTLRYLECEQIDYSPLQGNLFIIDEASMLDQNIASVLLQRIPFGAKVVLVGDPDQLPSVGPGNVLKDIIRSGTVTVTVLSVIFRQTIDNPIITNAMKIRCGDTKLLWTDTFRFLKAESADEVIQKAVRLYLRCVKAYGLDEVVLLCPYRQKSEVNTDTLNLIIRDKVNPIIPGALTVSGSGIDFRVGDKVMQLHNTEIAKNGDIGYIRSISYVSAEDEPGGRVLCAELEFNGDGVLHMYNEDAMKDLSLAYCSTVHKSQGEEYRIVIMIVSGMHGALLRRNILYTGITRAKEFCAIIGQTAAIQAAIRNERAEARYTLLADRLHAIIS